MTLKNGVLGRKCNLKAENEYLKDNQQKKKKKINLTNIESTKTSVVRILKSEVFGMMNDEHMSIELREQTVE